MKTILSFILILTVMNLQAQDTIIPLWPNGKIPNRVETDEKEEHVKEGILRISKVQEPTIEVYYPLSRMLQVRPC